MVLNISYLPVY